MPGVAVPHLRRIAANDTLLGVRRGEVAIINALGGSTKPKRCPSNMSCVAALKESLRLDKCSGFRNNRSRRRAFRPLFADPHGAAANPTLSRSFDFSDHLPPSCRQQPPDPLVPPEVCVCVIITKPRVYVLISRVTDPVNLELSCPERLGCADSRAARVAVTRAFRWRSRRDTC